MSKNPEEKGRIANLVTALKRLLAEDPLLFIVAVTCLAPLGGGIVATALSGDYNLVILLVLTMATVVLIVVIPLVITKTWKTNQRDLNGERADAVKEERVRRQASWEKSQERADLVINAKLANLKAQTFMLQDQSDNFQKFIIYESSRQFKEAVDERLESDVEVENRLEAKFVDKFSIITDSFAVVNKRYDNIVGNIAGLKGAIDFLSEEKAQPEITFKDKIADPDEIKEVSFESQYRLQIDENKRLRNKIAELEAGKEFTRDVKAMSDDIPTVEVSTTLPPTQNEVEKPTKDLFQEAIDVVDKIADDTDHPIPYPQPSDDPPITTKTLDINAISWDCAKCGTTNSNEIRRCHCGLSKTDSEKWPKPVQKKEEDS